MLRGALVKIEHLGGPEKKRALLVKDLML